MSAFEETLRWLKHETDGQTWIGQAMRTELRPTMKEWMWPEHVWVPSWVSAISKDYYYLEWLGHRDGCPSRDDLCLDYDSGHDARYDRHHYYGAAGKMAWGRTKIVYRPDPTFIDFLEPDLEGAMQWLPYYGVLIDDEISPVLIFNDTIVSDSTWINALTFSRLYNKRSDVVSVLGVRQGDYYSAGARDPRCSSVERAPAWVQKAFGLLQYAAAQHADIETAPRPTAKNRAQRRAPPKEPAIHHVGYRLGSAIRAQRIRALGSRADGQTRASVTPHVRRGHWHRFWIGPKNTPERRTMVRWVPPLFINANGPDDLVPVVRRVV
jgi:hypothetical protein